MDQLITEFTKSSDRSFLHDGEASKANMVRKYSGNDNVCVLYVIVMHCLKYFTTCSVFTRLVAKSVHNDGMICSGTVGITDHFIIEASHFFISGYFSSCRRELGFRFCYFLRCRGNRVFVFRPRPSKGDFSSWFRNVTPVNSSV